MMREPAERIERYLDGALSRKEAIAFEKDLLEPAVAQAFREALLIRELLQNAPPHAAPEGLAERIAQDLNVEARQEERISGSERFRTVRLIAKGASWIYEGPAMAAAGLPGTYWNMQGTPSDSSPAHYSRGPLGNWFSKRRSGSGEKGPSLWKRLLRRG